MRCPARDAMDLAALGTSRGFPNWTFVWRYKSSLVLAFFFCLFARLAASTSIF